MPKFCFLLFFQKGLLKLFITTFLSASTDDLLLTKQRPSRLMKLTTRLLAKQSHACSKSTAHLLKQETLSFQYFRSVKRLAAQNRVFLTLFVVLLAKIRHNSWPIFRFIFGLIIGERALLRRHSSNSKRLYFHFVIIMVLCANQSHISFAILLFCAQEPSVVREKTPPSFSIFPSKRKRRETPILLYYDCDFELKVWV
jgi:hypothetical protein